MIDFGFSVYGNDIYGLVELLVAVAGDLPRPSNLWIAP